MPLSAVLTEAKIAEAEAEAKVLEAEAKLAEAEENAAEAEEEYNAEVNKFWLFRKTKRLDFLEASWKEAEEEIVLAEEEVEVAQAELTATRHALAAVILGHHGPVSILSPGWFQVNGAIEHPLSVSGVRSKVISLAVGAYYPNEDRLVEGAFPVISSSNGDNLRVLCFSVVFPTRERAISFNVELDRFLVERSKHGLKFCTPDGKSSGGPPAILDIAPYLSPKVIYASSYMSQDDMSAPQAASLKDVEYQPESASSSSVTTCLHEFHDEFRFQRIESDLAFARQEAPELVHIFPKTRCQGEYKWLDAADFNRLAFSRDGLTSFDGNGQGRGKKAKKTPQVTLKPISEKPPNPHFRKTTFEDNPSKEYYIIPLALWCKTKAIAENWKWFLPNDAKFVEHERFCCFQGLEIYCAVDRRVTLRTEQMQQPDGTTQKVYVDKVPGLKKLEQSWSLEEDGSTLLVAEVMEKLLQWRFRDVMATWDLED